MHCLYETGVALFLLGPPVLYGKAKDNTALIGSSCSSAKLYPRTNTVGADLFTNAQAIFLMFHAPRIPHLDLGQ